MIWDFIRDFLVQYVFGGYTSTGDSFSALLGNFMFVDADNGFYENVEYLDSLYLPIGETYGYNFGDAGIKTYITIGDWLSTTATIIIMCLIVFLFVMLVRWVYKTVVSAFLLR